MIYKRGQTYWYKFRWTSKQSGGPSESFLIRRSARTRIETEAEEVEHEYRRAIRLGEVHPLDPWPKAPNPVAPLLRDFALRFLEFARMHVKETTLTFYKGCILRLSAFPELARSQISKITPELVTKYASYRSGQGAGVCAINSDLRTLRRILKLAFEWEVILRRPAIHELSGATIRSRVLSFAEEQNYLRAASPNLRSLAILAVDTGLRPQSELFCLEWHQIELAGSELFPYGCINVEKGKTKNAARTVPLTGRAREALLILRMDPTRRRWVFPGPGNSGHLISLQKSHRKALKKAGIEQFPFYCWRHTFGTRCAQSGMDRYTVAALMGHSSPRLTERYYIHVTRTHVSSGFRRFAEYQEQQRAMLQQGSAAPSDGAPSFVSR